MTTKIVDRIANTCGKVRMPVLRLCVVYRLLACSDASVRHDVPKIINA
jgi:hypothetical protein